MNSTDFNALRTHIQALYRSGTLIPEELDMAAERLWSERETEDRHKIDALAWACRLLGKSGTTRYKTVLSEVADKASHPKVRSYAKKALGQIGEGHDPQFTPGDISRQR